jgi:hypothetical protein
MHCHPEACAFCRPKDLWTCRQRRRRRQVAEVLRLAQDDKNVKVCQTRRPRSAAGLPGRPAQRPSADQVHVQVEHRLPRARPDIEHRPVSMFNLSLPRNCRRG